MPYLQIFIYIILILSIFSFLSIAPWVPTRTSDLERIAKILKLKKWEKFLEIWCWTAKVSLFLAKKNPENKIVWIELSLLFYLISKIRVFLSWLKNIEIKYWNAFKIDFHKYDVIYVFWLPETISWKLFPKLKKELKNTSRFFSYCFKMNNNHFNEIQHKECETVNSIYEYKKQ